MRGAARCSRRRRLWRAGSLTAGAFRTLTNGVWRGSRGCLKTPREQAMATVRGVFACSGTIFEEVEGLVTVPLSGLRQMRLSLHPCGRCAVRLPRRPRPGWCKFKSGIPACILWHTPCEFEIGIWVLREIVISLISVLLVVHAAAAAAAWRPLPTAFER